MRGHLALRRDDGAVFNHLHPGAAFRCGASVVRVTHGRQTAMKAAFGAEEANLQTAGVEREPERSGWK